MSHLRIKLAKVIEREMLEQHGLEVIVDPFKDFYIAKGFYRTSRYSGAYRWTSYMTIPGLSVGPMVDSYDTMTDAAKNGIILVRDRNSAFSYEATARNKN